LTNDTERADQRDRSEQPEHEPIKNHRHKLPVLLYLETQTTYQQALNISRSSGQAYF